MDDPSSEIYRYLNDPAHILIRNRERISMLEKRLAQLEYGPSSKIRMLNETVDSLEKTVEHLRQENIDLKEYFEQALREQEEKLMAEIYAPPEGTKSVGPGGIGYRKSHTHFETSTKK